MEQIKAWFKFSVTVLWARFLAAIGTVLAFIPTFTSDPHINDAIRAVLRPQYIPFYVIAIGIITEIARRRTASGQRPDGVVMVRDSNASSAQ